MNRKQKIIISITGIILVLLILLGLTYGYYLTQIIPNTNSTSISVETANLELEYGDGNGVLTPGDKIRPGNSINFNSNGQIVNEKTFTVTNKGDDTAYVVIVDNISITKAGIPTTFKTNDFKYTLTCKSYDKEAYQTRGDNATEEGSCDGVTLATFPLENQGILVGNRIVSNLVHKYTLTMEYVDNGSDQSDDMGKTFSARINIEDINRLENPYEKNKNSLAYNVLNNSLISKNGTNIENEPLASAEEKTKISLLTRDEDKNIEISRLDNAVETILENSSKLESSPLTKVAEEISLESEKVLSVTADDFGNSYYFRGNVSDNYVNFANMCWRIVRIQGNGSVKLILEDQDDECKESDGNWDIPASDGTTITMDGNAPNRFGNYGYEVKNVDSDSQNEYIMSYLNPGEEKNTAMVNSFKYFQTNLKTIISSKYLNKTISDYLLSGSWCLGDIPYSSSNSGIPLNIKDYSSARIYDSYLRLSGVANEFRPSLKCNGTVMDKFNDLEQMYVATLTADEVVHAGGTLFESNYDYYLMNDYNKDSLYFAVLSPSYYDSMQDYIYYVSYDGGLTESNANFPLFAFRPAISLKPGIEVATGGNGTKTNPYVVE